MGHPEKQRQNRTRKIKGESRRDALPASGQAGDTKIRTLCEPSKECGTRKSKGKTAIRENGVPRKSRRDAGATKEEFR
jgi:hypothetical protein